MIQKILCFLKFHKWVVEKETTYNTVVYLTIGSFHQFDKIRAKSFLKNPDIKLVKRKCSHCSAVENKISEAGVSIKHLLNTHLILINNLKKLSKGN